MHTKPLQNWLMLFAIIVLFMQTMTVWHDSEHDFHEYEAECEIYEAYNKCSSVDTVSTALLISPINNHAENTLTHHVTFISRQHDHETIRAPPRSLS
jgi:hypothetical protein